MDNPAIFQFLDDQQSKGAQTALVTVCSVDGSSMRNPGTHMAVCEDGSFAGSLSGGCIENAVVAEARSVISNGEPRTIRFGAGSPFLDIKLPCGGGLDLHFQPLKGRDLVQAACSAISQREPFSIAVTREGATFAKGWNAPAFDHASASGIFGHWPRLRLLIVGHGAGTQALALLARSVNCEVEVLTPDKRIKDALLREGIAASRLQRTSDTQMLSSDPWTAIIFLFHDHDWETDLMAAALTLPHFYIGAMGGRKAHKARCIALQGAGAAPQSIETIHAPIGLFHSSRDPQTLALSAMSQITLEYQRAQFSSGDA